MKLDALDHPKTMSLTAHLGCELPTTIGYLQLLWKFVGQHATQGNIGKWDDGAIARACMWNKTPADFVNGLVDSGFVDRSEPHRLVVHDWEDHAPSWVRAKLKKLSLQFITEKGLENVLESTSVASIEPSYRGEERSGKEKRGGEGKKPHPTEQEVVDYFLENGYLALAGKKAFKYYSTAEWKDSKGNPVKNWKQKMISVWFKDENLIPEDKNTPFSKAQKLAKQKGLEGFKGHGKESPDEFIVRINTAS